jgi:hypothetical protein
LLFILSLLACKTSKIIEKGPLPNRTKQEISTALFSHNVPFEWFSAKADVEIDSPEFNESGDLNLRLRKDEKIWLQIKKFSIEGFRGLINKDSFYLINRLEKTFVSEEIKTFQLLFGADLAFEDIQQMVVGNIFLPKENEITTYIQEGENCKLSANTSGFNVIYTFNAFDLKLISVMFTDRSGRKVIVDYSDYKKKGKNTFAFNKKLTFQTLDQGISVLNIKITELELNVEKTMPFDIPSHYEKTKLN